MSLLSFALLGRTDVRHAGAPLTLPTRKALALLVYLAAEGGSHPREKLAALFWPESDEERARAMLRYTLASLRRALGDPAGAPHLVSGRDAVGLDFGSGVELDLHALEAAHRLARTSAGDAPEALGTLRRAAERCRGEFLEDLTLPDAPDFDEWAGRRRESWRQQAEGVLDRLSRLLADRGELAEAVETARRWVALNPLNEAAHRRLMRLHLATGDRTAALRAYEACRAILDTELQVAPAPETEALAERIRLAEPPTREASRDGRAAGPARAPRGPAGRARG